MLCFFVFSDLYFVSRWWLFKTISDLTYIVRTTIAEIAEFFGGLFFIGAPCS